MSVQIAHSVESEPAPVGRAGSPWRVVRWVCMALTLALGAATAQPEGGEQAAQPAAAVPSHRQADNVAIITIEGLIDRVTSFSFQRRLAMAEQAGAGAIVVELDTPGGEVGAVLEICDAIRNSPITNSVAWINPEAYSGGAIIALACKEIVTTRSADMGDALPIQISMAGELVKMPEAERQKITAPLLAEVVGSARLRGWDEFVVQGFVALGVELWWVRDTQTGEEFAINEAEFRMLFDGEPPTTRPLINTSAPVLSEAPSKAHSGGGGDGSRDQRGFIPAGPELEPIEVGGVEIGELSERRVISADQKGRYQLVTYLCDGRGSLILDASLMGRLGFAANVDATGAVNPILGDDDLKAFFGAKNVRRLQPSWSERLVIYASNPIARGVLLVVFLLMMFLELSHPGVGVPGLIALLALLGLLTPPALIGLANWWEIAAIGVGILLILVEVLVLPGFGIPGIAGLLMLFGGMLGTFVAGPGGLFPDSPTQQTNLMFGLLTMILALVTTGVGWYYLSKHFGSLPILGRLILSDDDEEGEGLLAAIGSGREHLPAVGAKGEAITPLRPSGRAQFGEKVVDVVCDLGYVEAGARIKVVAADEFRVVVEQIG